MGSGDTGGAGGAESVAEEAEERGHGHHVFCWDRRHSEQPEAVQ